MNKLIDFLTYDFKCFLKEHYIIDSYQYIDSTFYKLHSASLNLQAITNLVNEKKHLIKTKMEEQELLLKTNHFCDISIDEDNVSFLGVSIDRYYAYNKLFTEIYSNLHSFFDVFAQYVNLAFLGDEALTERLSVKTLCNKFKNFSEYNGNFYDTITNLLSDDRFQYIEDLNNTCKHRFQILSHSEQNLFSGDYKLTIPSFSKDGRTYPEKDLLTYTEDLLDFCINIFYESLVFLQAYLTTNNHLRTKSRIYNVKSELQFNSKQDYLDFKPSCFEVYIVLDTINQHLDFYKIMFVKTDAENQKIEMFNCPYKDILVKDNANNIIGILTLSANEKASLLTETPIKFKTYKFTKTKDYSLFYNHIFDINKSYYPLLSDAIIKIIND